MRKKKIAFLISLAWAIQLSLPVFADSPDTRLHFTSGEVVEGEKVYPYPEVEETVAVKQTDGTEQTYPLATVAKIERFYTNGDLMSESYFQNGKKEGIEKAYYKDGKWSEWPFRGGKLEGTVKFYFQNGQIKLEQPFKNDEKDGVEKEYYQSGALERETSYKNGTEDGPFRYYYENGKLKTVATYQNGDVIHQERYDEAGNLIPRNQ